VLRKRLHILVVEDNKADVFLIREALEAARLEADLQVAPDGEKALQFFEEVDRNDAAPCPDLVIIDINLPRKHGGEVLRHMRNSRRCANALVLVVTSSDSDRDREEMGRLGANGYFRKPSDYHDFMKLGEIVAGLLLKNPGGSAPQ
jgi:two-component system, chemotaxis family, response regulator Rcp1